jgi:hypothetical protein
VAARKTGGHENSRFLNEKAISTDTKSSISSIHQKENLLNGLIIWLKKYGAVLIPSFLLWLKIF